MKHSLRSYLAGLLVYSSLSNSAAGIASASSFPTIVQPSPTNSQALSEKLLFQLNVLGAKTGRPLYVSRHWPTRDGLYRARPLITIALTAINVWADLHGVKNAEWLHMGSFLPWFPGQKPESIETRLHQLRDLRRDTPRSAAPQAVQLLPVLFEVAATDVLPDERIDLLHWATTLQSEKTWSFPYLYRIVWQLSAASAQTMAWNDSVEKLWDWLFEPVDKPVRRDALLRELRHVSGVPDEFLIAQLANALYYDIFHPSHLITGFASRRSLRTTIMDILQTKDDAFSLRLAEALYAKEDTHWQTRGPDLYRDRVRHTIRSLAPLHPVFARILQNQINRDEHLFQLKKLYRRNQFSDARLPELLPVLTKAFPNDLTLGHLFAIVVWSLDRNDEFRFPERFTESPLRDAVNAVIATVMRGTTAADFGFLFLTDRNAIRDYFLARLDADHIPTETLVQSWLNVLRSKDTEDRRRAARALGPLQNSAAVVDLIAALDDPDSIVRDEAAQSLEQIPLTPETALPLYEKATHPRYGEPFDERYGDGQRYALREIGRLGTPAALELLTGIVKRNIQRGYDLSDVPEMVEALDHFHTLALLAPLREAMQTGPQSYAAGIRLLERREIPVMEQFRIIVSVLNAPGSRPVKEAITDLGRLHLDEAVPVLIPWLNGYDQVAAEVLRILNTYPLSSAEWSTLLLQSLQYATDRQYAVVAREVAQRHMKAAIPLLKILESRVSKYVIDYDDPGTLENGMNTLPNPEHDAIEMAVHSLETVPREYQHLLQPADVGGKLDLLRGAVEPSRTDDAQLLLRPDATEEGSPTGDAQQSVSAQQLTPPAAVENQEGTLAGALNLEQYETGKDAAKKQTLRNDNSGLSVQLLALLGPIGVVAIGLWYFRKPLARAAMRLIHTLITVSSPLGLRNARARLTST